MDLFWRRIRDRLRRPGATVLEAEPEEREPAGIRQRVLGLAGTVLDVFFDTVDSEHQEASDELVRVRGVLHDAVTTLRAAFASLDRISRGQNDELNRLVTRLQSEESAGDEISIRDFVRRTNETLQYFTELLAQVSKQSVEASYKMDDMVSSLDEMFSLVGRVDEVADRTNMLALNASITAAQAGESGKAFGVVATEVKSLSRASKQLNGAISNQAVVARRAIEETRAIIRGMASKDLLVALEAKNRVDQMLHKLVALDDHLGGALETVGQASQQIARDVGDAVRVLQFEEIATQVLTHAQTRLERLGPLADVVRETLEPREETAGETTTRLSDAKEELAEVVDAVLEADRGHVEQKSMAAGDVELF